MFGSIYAILRGQESSLLEDILENLTMIFNTRQGDLIHLPDYGLPDINTLYQDLPHSIAGFMSDMKNLIHEYEPRLQTVDLALRHNEDHNAVLSIQLTGTLANGRFVMLITDCMSSKSIVIKSREYSAYA